MTKQRVRTVIHGWDDVPQFASEEEEAAWWPTVDFVQNSSPVPDEALPPKRSESVPDRKHAHARLRRARSPAKD